MLAERPVREADRVYSILTRNLGLIQATAIGVRKAESKLRGALEPFILSSISLVRGKDHWRVTSAESIRNIPASAAIARPLCLLEKLIQGEAPHPELFDAVEEAVLFYPECSRGAPKPDDEMFETNLVSKILFHLGYLKKSDLTLDKKNLIKAINNGLQSSHLI